MLSTSISKMSERNIENSQSKFTKGEKCILIHVTVTLFIILILVAIYVVHLLLVDHEGFDFLRITRRDFERLEILGLKLEVPNYSSVGVAFVSGSPARIVCNTILLRHQWSLAPAHCAIIRSDPELSQLLPKWRLKYRDGDDKETDIKRSVVHSFYNKDDFENNIGLFEHMDPILIPELTFPDKVVRDLLKYTEEDLKIVGWSKIDELTSNSVRLLQPSNCSQFVSPIVETPRDSELCVSQSDDDEPMIEVHGGALIMQSQIVGFFSWSDRTGFVPQVVLAIQPYRSWLESMMSMSD